ncbi:MAG: pyridoxal phosphate-dependent aminotransferase [Gammaproteobacteria bacterium]
MTDDAPVPAVARRMDAIAPFHVMDVLARARALERAGRTIVHMEIGEPDFATPAPVIEAGMRALRAGLTHYTSATGLPELRAAIAGFYRSRAGIEVDPARIVVTPGASGALQLILGVLLNPGDRVLMADPGYPCNRHFVRMFEGEAAGVPVDAATGYQLTAALLEAHWTPDTRAVLLASPSNPTGTLIAPDELARIAALAEARGAALIVDEIYQGLVYEGRAETALHRRGTVFVLNSFSKYFCMTGWRIGWLVAPERFIPAIDRLAQNIFLATSTPAQYAALACFESATLALLEQRREEFRARRDFLLPALRGLGFDIPLTPQGAFYLYADCSRHTKDSYAFCLDLLERAGVAITPGRDFGHHRPERHVRFAYTTGLEQLRLGVERLGEYLGEG